MYNIVHFKVVNSSNFLLKNNNNLLKCYTFNYFKFLKCTNLHMSEKSFKNYLYFLRVFDLQNINT
jgi:hypothetical protein